MIESQWQLLRGTLLTYGASVHDLEKLTPETKQALVMFYNHIYLQAINRQERNINI
jgi:hypothetical protein